MNFKEFERFFGNVKGFFLNVQWFLRNLKKKYEFKQIEGILGNVKEFYRSLMIFYEFEEILIVYRSIYLSIYHLSICTTMYYHVIWCYMM
jgi:hypothetical protein